MSIKNKVKNIIAAHLVFLFVSGILFFSPRAADSGETAEVFTLEKTIQTAVKTISNFREQKKTSMLLLLQKTLQEQIFYPFSTLRISISIIMKRLPALSLG